MTERFLASLVFASPLWAQAASIGLRAGVPVPPAVAVEGHQQTPPAGFVIGPTIEVRFWRGSAVGADFLLRRAPLADAAAGSPQPKMWQWEAPITFVYRFRAPARPFARSGVSFNRVFDIRALPSAGQVLLANSSIGRMTVPLPSFDTGAQPALWWEAAYGLDSSGFGWRQKCG